MLVAGLLIFTLFNSSDAFLLLALKNRGFADTAMIGFYIFYNMAYALLQNRDGKYPAPVAANFAAAAAGADWAKAPGNYLLLLNQPGVKAWPITGATFILVHKDQTDPAKAAACFRQVLALKPRDAAAHNNLGNALVLSGRLAEGIGELEGMFQKTP